MKKIRVKAHGKVNLGLDVIGRRENGYHDINMVMQTVKLHDEIHLEELKEDEIRLKGNHEMLPLDERNIVYRAIQLVKEEYQIKSGVLANIVKRIPIAAGMGGGSADAAATLRGMSYLFDLQLSEERLMELGLRLGADVPFCIMKGTAEAGGIGEKLRRLPPPPHCFVLLAKPDISVSTKEVYEVFDSLKEVSHPRIEKLIETLGKEEVEPFCKALGNVLEEVTAKRYSVVEEIKRLLLEDGAMAAMMTGSGPTVFGIFRDKNRAKAARKRLLKESGLEKVVVTEWLNR